MKHTIDIPEPCHEKWKDMTPTEKGRHCANCQKEVIDFTNYSDAQIIQHIQNNKNICGVFRNEQLNRELQVPKKQRFRRMAAALVGISSLISFSEPVYAQISQTETNTQKVIAPKLDSISWVQITGTVYNSEKVPLVNVQVFTKNENIRTVTDENGAFLIAIPKEKFQKEIDLVASHTDYETKTLAINQNDSNLYVELLKTDAAAKQREITGTVYDKDTNELLIGANIIFQKTGTATDIDGNFTLSVPPEIVALTVSYVGYNSQDVPINRDTKTMEIKLENADISSVGVMGVCAISAKDIAQPPSGRIRMLINRFIYKFFR